MHWPSPPRPLAAQAVSGTILGTVADTTGAVIPGAQFAQPNGQLGNSAFGTITAMAAGACGTCGTSERQIQLGVKLIF